MLPPPIQPADFLPRCRRHSPTPLLLLLLAYCCTRVRSFPALSCEFATLDVSDALGTKRMNLTKTLRKTPIDLNLDHHGAAYEDNHKVQPKYDDEDMWVSVCDCEQQKCDLSVVVWVLQLAQGEEGDVCGVGVGVSGQVR